MFQRLSAVKSMSIHYHDLFSHQGATDIVNMATDHGKESSPEFSAVVAALRTLDAVVVTNCGGEVTTHLFLWMASLGKHTNGPVIMMDMSNIVFVLTLVDRQSSHLLLAIRASDKPVVRQVIVIVELAAPVAIPTPIAPFAVQNLSAIPGV